MKTLTTHEDLRRQAQSLHKKLTSADHAAIRANAGLIAAESIGLARSVKALLDSQRTDAKDHLRAAVSALEDAAKEAQEAAKATDAQAKAKGPVIRGRLLFAVQQLSQAVARERAALVKA